MNLYVYRINDREYGAGLGLDGCRKLGEIVEEWPLNTLEQAKFLATHGTSYGKVTHLVTHIANIVHELMMTDPTYRPEPDPQPKAIEPAPEPKRGFFQRIKSWCYAR